ncbi:MAG TPA: phage portal protein, partial [Firmicutes bacterium]|nr:phage portal protein [Bacillota bacterium]
MAERRSLFAKIFGAMRGTRELAQLRVLSGYTPVFSPWPGQPYEADVVRSAVDAIARNGAKLRAKHVRRQGSEILHVSGEIERILSVRPNANMSAYDFLYRLITTLLLDNNAFAYPVWDGIHMVAA